jgi:hypothetical protein
MKNLFLSILMLSCSFGYASEYEFGEPPFGTSLRINAFAALEHKMVLLLFRVKESHYTNYEEFRKGIDSGSDFCQNTASFIKEGMTYQECLSRYDAFFIQAANRLFDLEKEKEKQIFVAKVPSKEESEAEEKWLDEQLGQQRRLEEQANNKKIEEERQKQINEEMKQQRKLEEQENNEKIKKEHQEQIKKEFINSTKYKKMVSVYMFLDASIKITHAKNEQLRQKKIAEQSGYINQTAMYNAGVTIIDSTKIKNDAFNSYKKFGGTAANAAILDKRHNQDCNMKDWIGVAALGAIGFRDFDESQKNSIILASTCY